MSGTVVDLPVSLRAIEGWSNPEERPLPVLARWGLALVMVAIATGLAAAVQSAASRPSLTLIYVLPVVVAATTLGLGPSLVAAITGALAFDFFFTAPYFSLAIYSAHDIWAAALLLVIGALVSAVAGEARRRALEATHAMEQSHALHEVAHAVLQAQPPSLVIEAAARALSRIFHAPSVVLMQRSDGLTAVASAGEATLSAAERTAAAEALATRRQTRGNAYPFGESRFDFWPIAMPAGGDVVLGVGFGDERPKAPERLVELVGSYLTVAFAATTGARPTLAR